MAYQLKKHFSKKEKIYGQFFTPRKIADFMISFSMLHLDKAEKAIDPACGDGVFLSSLIDHGFKEVWGVDIDKSAVKKIPKNIKKRAKIIIGDALIRSPTLTQNFVLPENYFDLSVGNPPFSAKYGRISDYRIKEYSISKNKKSEAIEVLFLERFITLVRHGGVVGIIVPDGILINKNYRYVREFILKYNILAVISLPRGIFRSSLSTTSKTSIIFLKKEKNVENEIFMADVQDVNDLQKILKLYREKRGLWVKPSVESLHPKTYKKLEISFRVPSYQLKELITEMRTGGTEYGKKRKFSTKGIKFISAKVVMPYGLDFKRDEKYIEPNSPMDKTYAHTKVGDLLFVRVGVGCAGRCAVVVDENDIGVADDWIYIIRVNENRVLPHYLAVFMQTNRAVKQLETMKRGVGTVTIPQSELKKLIVPVPPKNFQEKIKKMYLEMVKHTRVGNINKAKKIFEDMKKIVEDNV